MVYDSSMNIYRVPGMFFTRHKEPSLPKEASPSIALKFEKLASIVQSYSYMYYHFLVETLSRVLTVRESAYYTSDVKLLLQIDELTTEVFLLPNYIIYYAFSRLPANAHCC